MNISLNICCCIFWRVCGSFNSCINTKLHHRWFAASVLLSYWVYSSFIRVSLQQQCLVRPVKHTGVSHGLCNGLCCHKEIHFRWVRMNPLKSPKQNHTRVWKIPTASHNHSQRGCECVDWLNACMLAACKHIWDFILTALFVPWRNWHHRMIECDSSERS